MSCFITFSFVLNLMRRINFVSLKYRLLTSTNVLKGAQGYKVLGPGLINWTETVHLLDWY